MGFGNRRHSYTPTRLGSVGLARMGVGGEGFGMRDEWEGGWGGRKLGVWGGF